MKVCPKCAGEFDDQLAFCRQDGTALSLKQAVQICDSCGKEVGDGQKFCRYCGARLDAVRPPTAGDISQTSILTSLETKVAGSAQATAPPIQRAEEQIKRRNYREAISTLDAFLKVNSEHQEACLLHLLASLKLYNIYGYEKQIESLRSRSKLSEKEREIVREVFLIRAEEAQKNGKTDEAREYKRLAARVVLGQSLIEIVAERPLLPTQPKPPALAAPMVAAQRERLPYRSARPTARRIDVAPSYVPKSPQARRSNSRLLVSFAIVFGLAVVLTAGMLVHYAKKRGVNVTDIFTTRPSPTQQPETKLPNPNAAAAGQVLAVEELGFKVWGAGAADPNRKESVISERIGSQLLELRQLYLQEIQHDPNLMGSLILQLTISPAGGVTKVEEYAARLEGNEFKKAVMNEAYKWRFPEANGGLTKVNYPLLFVPPKMDVATVLQWERSVGSGKQPSLETKDETQVASQTRLPEPTVSPGSSGPIIKKGASLGTSGDRGGNQSAGTGLRSAGDTAKTGNVTLRPSGSSGKPIIGQYEVIHSTSVYREPRDDSPMIARIEPGTKISVVDSRGEWLEVRSRHGRPPGFVKKDAAAPLSNR